MIVKILVDADACPVKEIIIRIAKKHNISVTLFMDTSHAFSHQEASVITVDKGRDAVDLVLINHVTSGDIVVSQDYGVATMALSKNAYALSDKGLIFTAENIDQLLFERFLSQKMRRASAKNTKKKGFSRIAKRTSANDDAFEKALVYLIQSPKK